MYQLNGFGKPTPPQNRQLIILISKREEQVDDVVGGVTFQNRLINTFCEMRLCVYLLLPLLLPLAILLIRLVDLLDRISRPSRWKVLSPSEAVDTIGHRGHRGAGILHACAVLHVRRGVLRRSELVRVAHRDVVERRHS